MSDWRELSKLLTCPITGRSLRASETLGEVSFRAGAEWRAIYESRCLPLSELNGWLISDDERTAYPVVSAIPILLDGFALCALPGGGFQCATEADLNPFTFHQKTNATYYRAYSKVVGFKTEFIAQQIRPSDRIVVEFLSSEGLTLSSLKALNESTGAGRTYIAVDCDYVALLQARRSGLSAICSDVRQRVFRAGTVDMAFSNSLHHVPDDAVDVLHILNGYLSHDGRFAGVEAQGSLARLALAVIKVWPRKLMPFILSEIKTERDLLDRWLESPLVDRLKSAGITSFQVRYRGPHVMYDFAKGSRSV